jgi:hypothetical protein
MMNTTNPDAAVAWSCARKKAYSDEAYAKRISAKLNAENSSGQGRPGYEGVVVVPYGCTHCGYYHIGRSNAAAPYRHG